MNTKHRRDDYIYYWTVQLFSMNTNTAADMKFCFCPPTSDRCVPAASYFNIIQCIPAASYFL